MERDTPAAPGDPEQLGPYRILAPIGRGGMGAVYRAQDPETGQIVALKTVLLPRRELLQSLRREILALARLEHPGIVKIVSQGVEAGLPWYAMELVEGASLGQFAAETRGNGAGPPQPTLTMPVSAATEALAAPAVSGLWSDALNARTQLEVWAGAGAGVEQADDPPRARLAASPGPVSEGAVRRILSVARRLSLSLAYLHGEGIVHRDLKPGNVMVRSAGGPGAAPGIVDMPVIVDFGLAANWPFAKLGPGGGLSAGLESRETLETGSLFAGTVAYMAPEQKAGELVDARADLYALGAILYELLTGRRLFGTKRAEEQRRPQRREPETELPEGWEEPLPRGLEPLLRGLLAREPQKRIGYASAAAAALFELGAEEDETWKGPQARAYLYRPRFIGRQATLRQLEQGLAGLEAGRGGLVLLTGESGAGKTRLAMEMCGRAVQRGVEVLLGECDTPRSGQAVALSEVLQGLRRPLRALADRCREQGEAETRRLFGERARLLALYEPAVGELPGVEALPEPPELPPGAARLRLFSALSQTFKALAEAGSALLVLDDLQWADELTTGFVEHLVGSGELERQGLLVVGTLRSGETPERLEKLSKNPEVRELRLERLDGAEIGALVRDMLALAEEPRLFVEFLARQSEGNPLFIAEYLRSAVAQSVLYQDGAGRWCVAEPEGQGPDDAHYERLALPLSVRGLMEARLAVLGKGARRLAELAAVLGREAPEKLLFEMAEKLLGEALSDVEELVVREVLEERWEEPGQAEVGGGPAHPQPGAEAPVRFRFVHEQLRQVVYQGIEGSQAPRLHRAAAEAIETLPTSEREDHLAALGYHWEQAGEPLRARPVYLAAAQLACARSAIVDSEPLYRACLRLTGEPDETSETAMRELGFEVLHRQVRSVEARELILQALEISRTLGLRLAEGLNLRYLGILARLRRELDEASSLLEAALAIFHGIDDRKQEGAAVGGLGVVRMEQGRMDEAQELYQQAISLAREVGDQESEGINLANLGILATERNCWREASVFKEQAVAVFRKSGHRQLLAVALQNLAFGWISEGEVDHAEATFQEALVIQQELHDKRNQLFTLSGLGNVAEARSQYDKAREYYERSWALAQASGEMRACLVSGEELARVELHDGFVEKARDLVNEGLRRLRGTGPNSFRPLLLRSLARMERLGGKDPGLPKRLLRRAMAAERRAPAPSERVSILCEQGHETLASNRSAARRLRQARKLVDEMGVGPRSDVGLVVARLERAQAAFLAGRPLLRGECAEDVPEPLRESAPLREAAQDVKRSRSIS